MAEKPIKHASINLSGEEWDKLETLSALDFSLEQVATYFGISKTIFGQVACDPNSYLSERLQTGKLKQDADERLALYALARKGDVPVCLCRSNRVYTQRKRTVTSSLSII